MKHKKLLIAPLLILALLYCSYSAATRLNWSSEFEVGQPIDSLDGVAVYFNGGVNNVVERNLSQDGYNLGLKYQCVEFVKRYYYEHFNHRMPDSYGHARDFFNAKIANGKLNSQRNLFQYTNGKGELPKKGDLLVLAPTILNRFGHVSIVSEVDAQAMSVEVIQQNPGPFSGSRENYVLSLTDQKWRFENDRVLGWLRK